MRVIAAGGSVAPSCRKSNLHQHEVRQEAMKLARSCMGSPLISSRSAGDVVLDGPDRWTCISVGREAGIEMFGGRALAREFTERCERPDLSRGHRLDGGPVSIDTLAESPTWPAWPRSCE